MQNREICEGSQKAKSFLFETAFRDVYSTREHPVVRKVRYLFRLDLVT